MCDGRLQELCDKIFSISQNIRFAGVITKMGRLVVGGMKPELEYLEDKDDSSKLYVQFALMAKMRKDFDRPFGKAIYSFTEREKFKIASFPLDDNHILRVSIEKKEMDHAQIIQNRLGIIQALPRTDVR
jgi:hypothetical protein